MKDRVVVRTQDFGADGVHVARYPGTNGPTVFGDMGVAAMRAPPPQLRECVVMDVATAEMLEQRSAAYGDVCNLFGYDGSIHPSTVVDKVHNAAKLKACLSG